MAAGASVRIYMSATNVLGGFSETYDRVINLTNPVGTIQSLSFSSTPTLLSVPPAATFILIVPPTDNGVALFVGGPVLANMATISPTIPTLLAVPSPASVYLAAASAVSGITIAYY